MRNRPPPKFALGTAVPLGIPPVFITELLERSRASPRDLQPLSALLAEYSGATGYAFDWGHIAVVELAAFTIWRVVPVRLWEAVIARHGRSTPPIAELLAPSAPLLRSVVWASLPRGLALGGVSALGRRSPHALVALVLVDPATRSRAWRWLERRFLPELLPALLSRLESALLDSNPPVAARAVTPG